MRYLNTEKEREIERVVFKSQHFFCLEKLVSGFSTKQQSKHKQLCNISFGPKLGSAEQKRVNLLSRKKELGKCVFLEQYFPRLALMGNLLIFSAW